jgi:hypothetical protein
LITPKIKRLLSAPWLAEGITFLGGIWYLIQLWNFAHTQESVLDEGAYLYKGYLFATGQYTPYQPYGPWTNHTPLAFLIPGFIQRLFGPGLATARYFAILLAMLTLLGMGILSRRLGGRWWAVAAVWAIALNPALAKIYSVAISQGLVAFMLTWMLVLVLGEKRPLWQIILGAILSGLMVMTRINMLPVPPLLVLYILWEYGLKASLAAGLAGGLTIVIGHAIYWPNILSVWTRLPRSISPFLNKFRVPKDYDTSWNPNPSLLSRILSFFHSIRFQFTAMIGALATWLLWPKRDSWKKRSDFRASVFVSALFISLALAHLWASLGKDYCPFCLAGYMSFFSLIGLILLILSFLSWRKQVSWWFQVIIAVLIVAISVGIGFGAFEDIGTQLLNIQVPRVLIGDFKTPGYAGLGAILTNKFGLESQDLRRLVPSLFGLVAGIILLVLAFGIKTVAARMQPLAQKKILVGFSYWALIVFLISGTLLTPTPILAGGYRTYDCTGDVIQSYRTAGERLAKNIPSGSLVYWRGGLSVVPLLYVPGIKIFPPQINDGYSYFLVGKPDVLLKFGYWNEELDHRWLDEADFILVEKRNYDGDLRKSIISLKDVIELEPTPPTVACRSDSRILIFKRAP